MGVGTPQCNIFCSGSEELFTRVKPVLMAFGDNIRLVGNEIGEAATLEVAALAGFVMSALFGFFQGYVICEMENLPVERYVQFIKGSMPALERIIARVYGKLQKKDYEGDQSSLEAWSVAPKELIGWCRDHGVDHSIADAQLSLFDKAIKAGQGQADVAYLYEVLKAR